MQSSKAPIPNDAPDVLVLDSISSTTYNNWEPMDLKLLKWKLANCKCSQKISPGEQSTTTVVPNKCNILSVATDVIYTHKSVETCNKIEAYGKTESSEAVHGESVKDWYPNPKDSTSNDSLNTQKNNANIIALTYDEPKETNDEKAEDTDGATKKIGTRPSSDEAAVFKNEQGVNAEVPNDNLNTQIGVPNLSKFKCISTSTETEQSEIATVLPIIRGKSNSVNLDVINVLNTVALFCNSFLNQGLTKPLKDESVGNSEVFFCDKCVTSRAETAEATTSVTFKPALKTSFLTDIDRPANQSRCSSQREVTFTSLERSSTLSIDDKDWKSSEVSNSKSYEVVSAAHITQEHYACFSCACSDLIDSIRPPLAWFEI